MYHISCDRRSIQSSEWIYEALQKLIEEKCYEDISVTDIVNQANLGRSTFYRSFEHKDDVLRYKCHQTCLSLNDYLVDYQLQHGDLTSSAATAPFFTFWSGHADLLETIIKINRTDILTDAYSEILKQIYIEQNDSAIGLPEEHIEYLTASIAGSSTSVLIQWVKNKRRELPGDLAQIVTPFFMTHSTQLGKRKAMWRSR
ncbi:TetR/AcrR family transcriptional regulator [Paenibacillus daejeonensis]|uniref:TetR/AcrR family transcriptional regulator n=1 Tax=Paenibacillus daejeonensis TaxID=135193 RepID=UPI00036AAD88|nr:TetR/AcrR family transcriptional regulator [Paenibacillus daejeonensis]